MIPIILMIGCAKGEPATATDLEDTDTSDADTDTDADSDTDADTDADSDADTDTDTDTDTATDTGSTTSSATCDPVNAGSDWAWNGACPGMLTPCEIEVTGCELAIGYSSGMSMGMPTSGLVTENEVTFATGGCVGVVVDPDTIEGTCSDGCTYTLTR